MDDPCNLCIERDRCSKEEPDICNRKKAFGRYKEKCKEIREKTLQLMEDAKRKANG